MFTLLEAQSPTASKFAFESCKKCLRLLETDYYTGEDRLPTLKVTLGDIVLFALLQNATRFYDKEMVSDCPNLKRFYEEFKERESAKVDEKAYPEDVKAVARHWIVEEGVLGRVKALGAILGVLPGLVGRLAR